MSVVECVPSTAQACQWASQFPPLPTGVALCTHFNGPSGGGTAATIPQPSSSRAEVSSP